MKSVATSSDVSQISYSPKLFIWLSQLIRLTNHQRANPIASTFQNERSFVAIESFERGQRTNTVNGNRNRVATAQE